MRTVKEVSKITGVSVRTLHHYDAIGLLKPTEVTEAGYRMYDDTALSRLQNILLFRELQFPLKEIKAILDSPNFDPSKAIAQQIGLLELQYKHIGELIAFAREIINQGVTTMNFDVFDKKEIEKYKAEVIAKWGDTKAYQEYLQKDIAQEEERNGRTADRLMALFSELGGVKHLSPNSEEAQKKISALQEFITKHYYTCTNEILRGLGEMYLCDERFQKNIDRAGGDGTAEFVHQAISVYCSD
ncbi:MAG: MerR family transcriptional regulator [Lachnospiraceae bacterium]|nr:MerR family transcriptional regulator [Lachnospiraceae bacterium]